jgi:methionyl-tRNA synthetase
MIGRYFEGVVPEAERAGGEREADVVRVAREAGEAASRGIESWDFDGALDGSWQIVRRANQYIDESEPWRLARAADQRARLGTVLYHAAESLRLLSIYLAPFIPGAVEKIRAQLGQTPLQPGAWRDQTAWGGLLAGAQVAKAQPIFPRIEVAATA